MTSAQTAVVLGASGSVGKALIEALIARGAFKTILSVVRRSQADQVALAQTASVELREVLAPSMTPDALERATSEAIRSLAGEAIGFSVLGVGARTAKLTIDEHRAVDVELNAAFARGLKASGRARHLAFMSAVGADPRGATTGSGAAGMARYARVKGEAEEEVKQAGPAVISIFRPAMIIGSQHTPWLLAKMLPLVSALTPANFRSISVGEIARAMIAAALDTPLSSRVYHHPEMMALIDTDSVRQIFAAINRGDIAAVLRYFDPKIERIEPEGFPMAGTYRGLADVGAHLAQGRGTWAEGACEPERFVIAGDKVIVFLHVRVKLKNRQDWTDGRMADVFTFRRGKAVQMRSFAEGREALAWAGVKEP